MTLRNQPSEIVADPASFKDPDAQVFRGDSRVFRRFTLAGATQFRSLAATGLIDKFVSQGRVIGWEEMSPQELPELYDDAEEGSLVVEHPTVPFLSYCYEWSFEMLRECALLHLDLLRECLEHDYILKDATPYNVQFIGPHPVFIDIASFMCRPPGTPWQAYAQFCRQFLNPLLLSGLTGVPFGFWLRSSLDGISPEDLTRLLPVQHKLRRGVLINVVLQGWLNRKFSRRASTTDQLIGGASFSKKQLVGLANRLEKTILGLKAPGGGSSWIDYETQNSYPANSQEFKERVVEQALSAASPGIVWDLGCNTGHYSLIAARHAKYVIAMDQDPQVIDALYSRVRDQHPNVLPLVMDALNPSPDQGWNQVERGGMKCRGRADFVLCLALVHHLAIGGNVPLEEVVRWLASLTNRGIIEFATSSDPMVQQMLRSRESAYPRYRQEHFEELLQKHFHDVERNEIPGTQRTLYVFSK